jgi:hypothetical protein
MALDEQVPHSEIGEHDRRAETAASAADDQHVDVYVHHPAARSLRILTGN